MRKLLASLLLVFVLSVMAFSLVSAHEGEVGDPVAGCPDRFELHHAMHHDMHHHHHIGSDTDFNGDGWICVKHVGANGNNHVHIDNYFPLQ